LVLEVLAFLLCNTLADLIVHYLVDFLRVGKVASLARIQ